MIYTVTFNPAIDYVVRLDTPLEVGEVNRAKGEDCVLGGKGINVSGVLAELGCRNTAPGLWRQDRDPPGQQCKSTVLYQSGMSGKACQSICTLCEP